MAVELSRVSGSAPQLITIGADKTLAIWDTMTFKVMLYLMYGFCIFYGFLFSTHVYFFSAGATEN